MNYDAAKTLDTLIITDQVLGIISYYRTAFDIHQMKQRCITLLKNGPNYKFIDVDHPNKYCDVKTIPTDFTDNGMAVTKPYKLSNADEFNGWCVTCYCGSIMPLRRLKCDFSLYKTCHCGSRFDIKSYHTDTYLYICPDCNLTHEAYQYTLTILMMQVLPCYQPTGIPASQICKDARLHVHQLINILIKEHAMTKNDVYELIAKLLNISRKEAHIGRFPIDLCYVTIIKLQDYIEEKIKTKQNKTK